MSVPEPDGSEFIVKRVDEGVAARLRTMEREEETVQKTANFPPWLTHVFGVILMCGAFLLVIGLDLLDDEEPSFSVAVSRGFWWFIGFGAGLSLLSMLFFVLQFFKSRAVMNSSAVKEHETKYEKIKQEALENMLVPQDAAPVDVFVYPYRKKDGKERGAMPARSLFNLRLHAFRDGEALCLADTGYVVRIPYDSIASIGRICKRTAFMGWNKEEKFNKGSFKPFHIRCNESGQMSVKYCYRVEIRGSEAFELLIPPYEFETLMPMLGYKAYGVIDVKK